MDCEFMVILDQFNDVCVINNLQLIQGAKKFYWPPYKDLVKCNSMIEAGAEVDENTWLSYSYKKVYGKFESYVDAKQFYNNKLKEAPSSSTENDEELPKTRNLPQKYRPYNFGLDKGIENVSLTQSKPTMSPLSERNNDNNSKPGSTMGKVNSKRQQLGKTHDNLNRKKNKLIDGNPSSTIRPNKHNFEEKSAENLSRNNKISNGNPTFLLSLKERDSSKLSEQHCSTINKRDLKEKSAAKAVENLSRKYDISNGNPINYDDLSSNCSNENHFEDGYSVQSQQNGAGEDPLQQVVDNNVQVFDQTTDLGEYLKNFLSNGGIVNNTTPVDLNLVNPSIEERLLNLEMGVQKTQEIVIAHCSLMEKVTKKILKKLEDLSEKNSSVSTRAMQEISSTLGLPVSTTSELETLEKRLQDDGDLAKFITLITRLGGNTPKNIVNNVMDAVFHPQISTVYTWFGTRVGTTQKKALKESSVISAISAALTENQENKVTEADIKTISQSWMKNKNDMTRSKAQAKDRSS